jgi:hypothetical protein
MPTPAKIQAALDQIVTLFEDAPTNPTRDDEARLLRRIYVIAKTVIGEEP